MEKIKKVLSFLKGWGAIVIATLALFYAYAVNKAAEASDRMLADNVAAQLRKVKGMENVTISGEYNSPNIIDMLVAPFRMLLGLAGSDPKTTAVVIMFLVLAGYILWDKIIKPWHKENAVRSSLSSQRRDGRNDGIDPRRDARDGRTHDGNRRRGGTQNDRRQPGTLPRPRVAERQLGTVKAPVGDKVYDHKADPESFADPGEDPDLSIQWPQKQPRRDRREDRR